MPDSAKNMTLPGQEVSLAIDKAVFKKDQNFMVAMLSEIEADPNLQLDIGDQINFHINNGPEKEWAGLGQVTHIMTCYLLDIPPFIMSKHQDPMFKNPMALYHHLQGRVGRLLSPTDKVVAIGFTVTHARD